MEIVDFAGLTYCELLDDLLSDEEKKHESVVGALMYWTSRQYKHRCTWEEFKKLSLLRPFNQLTFLYNLIPLEKILCYKCPAQWSSYAMELPILRENIPRIYNT